MRFQILTSGEVFGCSLAEIGSKEGLDLKPVITSWGQVKNSETVAMDIYLRLEMFTCKAILKLKRIRGLKQKDGIRKYNYKR